MRPSIAIVAVLVVCLFAWLKWNRPATETNSLEGSSRTSHEAMPFPGSAYASDSEVAAADLSILFVGNSHTSWHGMPQLVAELIRWRHPDKKVAVRLFSVSFLQQLEDNRSFESLLRSHSWDCVVLQAQAISTSGRFNYSTAEGIKAAREARRRGAEVFFFAEWGIQNDVDNLERTDRIYREMADQSDSSLIPVGKVWQRALETTADLPIYSSDRNHQSRLGASLTALTIATFLVDEDPTEFAMFPDPEASSDHWRTFCDSCKQIWMSNSSKILQTNGT